MSDLHVSGKSTIYDATIQKVGKLPEQPVSGDQDEIYFTLGDDLYVARGQAMTGVQNLKLGDWVSLDGKNGEIVRLDLETPSVPVQSADDLAQALRIGDAFSTAIDSCTSTGDGLAIALAAADADDRVFRWQIRSAVRKSLNLAQTHEELHAIAKFARKLKFPLLAARAERTAASPPQ